MTIEEAIERLNELDNIYNQLSYEDKEAIDMAIKALEQQPCDDCISRQAVDELSRNLVHVTRDKADFLCNFWEGLQKLPSVTPKEEIIHCKDCKYRDYWGDCTKWSKELDAHKSYILDENMFCGFAERK